MKDEAAAAASVTKLANRTPQQQHPRNFSSFTTLGNIFITHSQAEASFIRRLDIAVCVFVCESFTLCHYLCRRI